MPTWDEVEVEFSLGGVKPDIVLLLQGRPVAAIEIRVKSAVTASKENWFADNDVPWIEVRGTPELYAEETKWTPETALVIERQSKVDEFTCQTCHERVEAEAADHAERERQAKLAHDSRTVAVCIRYVDLYYSANAHRRLTYEVRDHYQMGKVATRSLHRSETGRGLKRVALHVVANASEVAADFDTDIARLKAQEIDRVGRAAFDDHPTSWIRVREHQTRDDRVFAGWRSPPKRLRWDAHRRRWVRITNAVFDPAPATAT